MEDGKLSGLMIFLLGALVAANWSKIKGWVPFVGEKPKS